MQKTPPWNCSSSNQHNVRYRPAILSLTVALSLSWGALPTSAQAGPGTKTINVCSHTSSDHYNIHSKHAAPLRAKLDNPANFGPDGDYGNYHFKYVNVGDEFTEQKLVADDCHIFFSGYETDRSYSSAELDALQKWVKNHKGQVVAGCDDTGHDPVCQLLGYSVTTDTDTYGFISEIANNPLNCNKKLTSGSKLEMAGGVGGYFSGPKVKSDDVLAVHETGNAADSGKPIAIYTGNYFFTSDVNMIMELTLSNGNDIENNNDILTMNAFSALADAAVGKEVCASVEEVAKSSPASNPAPACGDEASAPAATIVSHTPWKVAEGDGVIKVQKKAGMVNRWQIDALKDESDPAKIAAALAPYFEGAKIPAEGNRWKPVQVTTENDQAYFYRKLNAGITQCSSLDSAQYTYFETFVNIPQNYKLTQFSITFDNADMDDASRITIFNDKYKDGTVVPGSYVPLRGNGTSDLKAHVVAGKNRVVVTNLDNCSHITVPKINVVLNSSVVEQAAAPCDEAPAGDNGCFMLSATAVDGEAAGAKYYVGFRTDRMGEGGEPGGTALRLLAQADEKKYNFVPAQLRQVPGEGGFALEVTNYPQADGSVGKGKKAVLVPSANGQLYVQWRDKLEQATFSNEGPLAPQGTADPAKIGSWQFASGQLKGWYMRNQKSYVKLHPTSNPSFNNQDATWHTEACATEAESETALPAKFKVRAYSVHAGKKEQDVHWFALNKGDSRGRILSDEKIKQGGILMEIRKIDLGSGEYALKVENMGKADMYLVARDDATVHVDSVGQPLSDGAKFKSHKALTSAPGAHEKDYRSFESIKLPGRYLRHQGYIMFVHKSDNSELFKQDASWLIMDSQ